VTRADLFAFDTQTGAVTQLLTQRLAHVRGRAGPVTTDVKTSGRLEYACRLVIDRATRSLVMCEGRAHVIVRVRGVDI
jgi:hypothetical protein